VPGWRRSRPGLLRPGRGGARGPVRLRRGRGARDPSAICGRATPRRGRYDRRMTDQPEATRIERDSMGEMAVLADALYGAATQRAVLNLPISGQPLPRR